MFIITNYYESIAHGTHEFPIGVHDTSFLTGGFRLYPHIHNEFEFLVITKGQGIIYIDDVPYHLSEGDAIFINSKKFHLGEKRDESGSEFFAVVFSPKMLGSFGDDLIVNKYVMPVLKNKIRFNEIYCSDVKWQREVIEMLKLIYKENKNAEIGYEIEIKKLLLEIWRICFLHSEKNTEITSDRAIENIKKVFAYVQKEYASPISLDDIANHINMSKGYFCRRFSDITHMTPFEYILQVRIENSCHMLQNSNLSVGEIAQHCGFNSFSYFSKTFKKFMGCTPREYAKQNK